MTPHKILGQKNCLEKKNTALKFVSVRGDTYHLNWRRECAPTLFFSSVKLWTSTTHVLVIVKISWERLWRSLRKNLSLASFIRKQGGVCSIRRPQLLRAKVCLCRAHCKMRVRCKIWILKGFSPQTFILFPSTVGAAFGADGNLNSLRNADSSGKC